MATHSREFHDLIYYNVIYKNQFDLKFSSPPEFSSSSVTDAQCNVSINHGIAQWRYQSNNRYETGCLETVLQIDRSCETVCLVLSSTPWVHNTLLGVVVHFVLSSTPWVYYT